MKPPVKFKWRGNHHLYHGIWILAFSLFNIYMGTNNAELEALNPLWAVLGIIGAVIMADDMIEHTVTADTPLRILYVKIIRPLLISSKK